MFDVDWLRISGSLKVVFVRAPLQMEGCLVEGRWAKLLVFGQNVGAGCLGFGWTILISL